MDFLPGGKLSGLVRRHSPRLNHIQGLEALRFALESGPLREPPPFLALANQARGAVDAFASGH